MELAKIVRYRIKSGRFSGLCQRDAAMGRRARTENPPHEAVDWSTITATDGVSRVRATCPVCREPRWVEAKTVRKQLRRHEFTGACLKDRFLGRATSFPEAPGVDWSNFEMVPERDGSRRRMIRLRCPDCGAERLAHSSHLAEAIRKGHFRIECRGHRKEPVLSARAHRELLQLVRLIDTTVEDLATLVREVATTKPARALAS